MLRQCTTLDDMNAEEWVGKATNDASLRAIGLALDLNHVTVSRNIAKGDPATAVAIARNFGASPIEGLVAFNVITEAEAEHGKASASLVALTDEDLAREVLRRMKHGSAGRVLTDPIDPNVPNHGLDAVDELDSYEDPEAPTKAREMDRR